MATIDIDRLVTLMTTPSVTQPAFGASSNSQAAMLCPNYPALHGMCLMGGRKSWLNDYVNGVAVWPWFYPAPGHTAWTKRLQVRGLQASIKRISDGTWWNGPVHEQMRSVHWNGNTLNWTDTDHPTHRYDGDGKTSWRFRDNYDGVEAWCLGTMAIRDQRALMLDCAAVAAIIEFRWINDDGTPYYGADAKAAVKIGFDFYNTNLNSPAVHPGGNVLKDGMEYPKNQMDGGNSHIAMLTGGDWTSMAFITTSTWQRATGVPPWQPYTEQWPYNIPPYVLTEAQVRAAGGVPSWVTVGGVAPDPVDPSGLKRYNRVLQSEALANSAWEKENISVATKGSPPAPLSAWQTITVSAAGASIRQATSLSGGELATVSAIAAPESSNWLAMRFILPDFSGGVWAFFNISTGQLGTVYHYGAASGFTSSISPNPGGGYVCSLAGTPTSAGWIVDCYPCNGNDQYARTVGHSVNVGGFQAEAGAVRTHYKKTTTSIAERALTTVLCALSPSTVVANAASLLTITLQDETGAPWDQFGAITAASSAPTIATISPGIGATDASGIALAEVTGTSAGSSAITATAGGVTSAGAALTVTASGAGLTAPAAPTLQLGNVDGLQTSGALRVSWGAIAEAASAVVIEGKLSSSGEWGLWREAPKGNAPQEILNLSPGVTYNVRIRAKRTNEVSEPSPAATITMHRLFVFGHFEPEAVGVTGCTVTIGRGSDPDAGWLLPSELIAGRTGAAMDPSTVAWQGTVHSRMVFEMHEQPSPPLRDGDRIDMVVAAVVSGEDMQSKVLHGAKNYGAIVVEGP
ncbi:MAG: hypothetical protein IT480_10715 [Gammaproteobacteria bacterium]|nr:hypothetical protein [Gammaproteobacteria bacterium]